MFSHCVIQYPADEKVLKMICKELASFRAAATVQYVRSLNLNERQTEALFAGLERAVAEKREDFK